MKKQTCIILLSGGQDSTTCLYWAKTQFGKILCICFDYGQKHSQEILQAQKIASAAGCDIRVVNVKGILAKTSLLDDDVSHNDNSAINSELPASFAAGRNLLFLTIVGSIAAQEGVNDIVMGVCQTDYSGYPDCRKNTIDAMQLALSLGLGTGDMRIHTPLMYLTKAETWKLAKELDVLDIIIQDTMTDYNGNKKLNDWGYGDTDNPASVLRAKGFYEAKNNGWI